MLKENSILRQEARTALSGNWGMAAVVTLIYMVVSGIVSNIPWINWVVVILIGPVLGWGLYIVFYDLLRERRLVVNTLFDGFKDYGRIFGTMLLMNVYILLWALLLIVPGIIKSYSYAMTPYILRDNPQLSFNAAIEKSMAMMEGHKMKLFLLELSFIGWAILSCLTLGLGFLLLAPYVQTSIAAFYEDLKAQQEDVKITVAETTTQAE